MDILIIGADTVGVNLAEELSRSGDNVVVVDRDAEKLLALDYLDCTTILGVPLELEVLEEAGVKSVDAVACVTESENMNVMLGQMIKKIYNKEKVLVQISNPENESIYQAMGIETICSTTMIIEKILSSMGYSASGDMTTILGFPVFYNLRKVTAEWDGSKVSEIEKMLEVHILAVAFQGSLSLVTGDYRVKSGENLVILSLEDEREKGQ